MNNLSLFNINGHIGYGAYDTPDFPTAASFVEHLDYLEIDRSLVWHISASDLHPTTGNRRLVQDIEKPGLEQRLFPAFIITPACFFEYGAMDFLRDNLGNSRSRALRITPNISHFPIREIERVLEELAQFRPTLFWDSHRQPDINIRDIEHLANRFPEIAFVPTRKMWGGFNSILDLMWRCSNIYIDSSFLHMRDALELITEQFGAERILFGLGYKSHYGAAIAALAHADLTDSQRELIAHGNIERLLKIDPLTQKLARPPKLLEQKQLWTTMRSGKPIQNVEIIDAHGHTPPHTRGWIIRQQDPVKSIDAMIEKMDRIGISRLIISAEEALFGENHKGNSDAEKRLQKYKKRLSGYLVFNPLYAEEMTSHLDEFFKRDFFVGFKLLASYWQRPLTDSGYLPVWEYADLHQLPILLHTWNDSFSSPAKLKDIAKRYSKAVFLLGHSGGGTAGRLEAEALARENKNVYLEFCGSFTTTRLFETSLMRVGKDRVVFGSAADGHDQAWELGRYLSLPVSDKELIPGLSANMKFILAQTIPPHS